jgi:nanoRNase/pAp phosphatase (c-di-AMP/oligoRNAs hydrolase)
MARRFGGGGHTMASGMRLPGPMQRAIEEFLRECARLDDFPVR